MTEYMLAMLDITPTDRYRLRDIADAAYAYGVSLGGSVSPDGEPDYDNDKLHYVAGIEDVLRYIVGDAAPTADLADVLRGVV